MTDALLVVGADPHREAAFAAWARAGLRVGLVDGTSGAGYEHLADTSYPVDVTCADENTVGAIARIAAEYDGVTCLSEAAVRTAAEVAERLGLPGPGAVAADIATSKVRQRQVPTVTGPRFAAVRSPADLDAFFARGDVDAVLKPADASASAGVTRVASAADAIRAWPRVRVLSPTGTGIVEEFLTGPEYSVEAVVAGGDVMFTARTDKECGVSFLELAHTVSRPATVPDRLIRSVVTAWQVRDAVLHLEVKGEGDDAVLVEGAVRPGGDFIPELVAAVHGRDLYRDLAALALGRPLPKPSAPLARHAGVRFLLGSGRVLRQAVPAKVLDGLSRVRIARQLAQPGRALPPPVANWVRAGYALGWADDLPHLHAELAAAVGALGAAMGVEETGVEAREGKEQHG